MKMKNSKNNLEISVALFEISLIVLSILSFSYLIGEEIGVVSAFVGRGPHAAAVVSEILAESTIPSIAPGAWVSGAAGTFTPPILGAPSGSIGLTDFALEAFPTGGVPETAGAAAAGEAGAGATGTSYSVFGSSKASWLLQSAGTTLKGLSSTAVTALALYFVTKWVAGLIPGVSDINAAGLGLWGAIGYGIGGAIGVIGQTWFGAFSALGANLLPFQFFSITPIGLIGAGVFALGYILFGWRDYRAYLVTYDCLPWQPQSGGQYCEECNKPLFGTDEIRCSKYRCESLGSGCRIVDVGEEQEMCYWENKNDITAPEIVAWDEVLSEGFRYNPNIPKDQYVDGGVTIEYEGSADGCIPPYQRFIFGISLNKLGDCKVDSKRTATYDDMKNVISLGYPKYNHSIIMNLEGSIGEDGNLEFPNEDVELFVKCKSTSGEYVNDRAFVFKYCVQDELDTTAPRIMSAEPATNSPIKQGTTSQTIKIYVDKPSTCKWSYNNEAHTAMQNIMSGNDIIGRYGYYEYTTTVNGLKDLTENKIYINCESYPALEGTEKESQRTAMAQNYQYTLIGTKGLVIDSVSPKNGTIKDSTENVKVTVKVRTSQGYKDGESFCSLKELGASAAVPFFSDLEATYEHTQDLYLISGGYTYEITCCDIGLNCDSETINFNVETDFEAPMVVRAYNEGNSLKLITNEKAECVYDTTSCSYSFENGIAVSSSDKKEHTLDWDTENTFFIKCKDEFEGQPSADECTIIVRPSDSF